MDDIDCVIACHVKSGLSVGKIGIAVGGMNANSMGLMAEFFGKAAHAHSPQRGVDAIRMAVSAYNNLELMVAKEVPPVEPVVYNVGAFNAGATNNIVCDYAKLMISSRTWDDDLSELLERRTKQICEASAAMIGGSCKVTRTKLLPYVDNHPVMCQKMRQVGIKLLGEENVTVTERGMGGEDFSFLSRRKPGVLFQLGTANETNSDTRVPLHNGCFDVDEGCFAIGIEMFVNFVLENQDGIVF